MITGSTRVAGVIGDPIRHSLSPAIHNAAFAACGLDWVFVAFEVPAGGGARAIDGMRALGLGGLSVTMPHKGVVAAAVDHLSDDAAALGAVNCVVPGPTGLTGHNTDGAGFLAALQAERSWDADGKRVLVIGAGGAARAVVRALVAAGATSVLVVNRTGPRAEEAARLAGKVGRVATAAAAADVDLVVNATPAGMDTQPRFPIDPERLGPGQLLADLVYWPRPTPLITAAAARGADTIDGLGMLVHQAALAFTLWTGVEAPLDAMASAATAAMG